jgi:putative membrane protein
MDLIWRWIGAALGVAAAAWLVPGILVEGGATAYFVVALILGLVNAVVRPVLRWLACGLIVLTLGLFLLVINALMLLLTGWIAGALGIGFRVEDFASALVGSIIITLVAFVVSLIFTSDDRPARR